MRRFLLLCVCCLGLTGCAVRQVRDDHDKIRAALLDLYTDQLMDNLVREANGLPIIELDYINAGASLTVHESLGGSTSPIATTHDNALTLAQTISLVATRTVLNTFGVSLGADCSNQVQVTANPVTTTPQAYEAYREFLATPGSLLVTACAPPEGAAHLCKKCGHQYYWVPVEFRRQFLALALAAITDRASSLPPPDPFYTVTLLAPVSQTPVEKDIYRLILKIDKKIPNDVGLVELGPGSGVRVRIAEYQPDAQRVLQTDRLVVYYDESKAPPDLRPVSTFVTKLPMTARVYLASHRPTQPAVDTNLRFIEFQLQQIQLNQLRNP
jgi:hypothetical protein